MKYISTNIFTDFEFHDAFLKLESFEGNTLTVSAQCLNIHKNTEQNSCGIDMEIEVAHITFSNFKLISFDPGRVWKQDCNGKFYTDEPEVIFEGKTAEAKLLNELQAGMTVYEFGTLGNGNHYFAGAGDEPWFQVQFIFDSATVGWDEYRKPAWYERPPFNRKGNS